jgi:hypothetical protein
MTRRIATLIVLGLVSTLAAQEPPPAPAGQADSAAASAHAESSLLERFLAHHEAEPVTRYRATRRLEAENGRFNVKGWMEVVTELTPEKGFTWTVVEEGGSGYIRNKVLRKTLEGEADAIRNNDPAKAALNETNYVFALSDAAMSKGKTVAPSADAVGDGHARLFITPKRKDMMLVDGALLLAEADGDLVQVEGRLSKTPSFWTRSVDIVRRYARIAGLRVPVATESTANVRIAGRSEFRMIYTYQMINGRDVAAASATR